MPRHFRTPLVYASCPADDGICHDVEFSQPIAEKKVDLGHFLCTILQIIWTKLPIFLSDLMLNLI